MAVSHALKLFPKFYLTGGTKNFFHFRIYSIRHFNSFCIDFIMLSSVMNDRTTPLYSSFFNNRSETSLMNGRFSKNIGELRVLKLARLDQ